MKILVTYALEAEKWDIRMPGHELVFCATGVGKVSAALHTFQAIRRERPDLVLNMGSAGTLHHRVGDILVCARFLDRDLEKIAEYGVPFELDFTGELTGSPFDMSVSGCVSTGDTFQTDRSESMSAAAADVFDMEAFGGAQAARFAGIPFVSVKYVTDVIGENSIRQWEEKLQDAREGLVCFLAHLKS